MQNVEPGTGRDRMLEGGQKGYKMCEECVSNHSSSKAESSCSISSRRTRLLEDRRGSFGMRLLIYVFAGLRTLTSLA